MARALENPEVTPTYLEFFGMNRAPFARVSKATQVFHAEQYSLLYGHLSDATERTDHLLIISGANGCGKTTLLNRYIATLDRETSFATFDETCIDATQFYRDLLRQLGFSDLTGTFGELRHIATEFLKHRGLSDDPVLVIIDNAHLVSAAILEQLVWISDIEANDCRVISLVLSGNPDLTRVMDSPAMSLLTFERQTHFSIRVFSEQETDEYVRHRLRLAGGTESAKLTDESRPLIHRFSGGNPSLINRFCDAVLSEARNQDTRVISESLVRSVADEHNFVPHVVPVQEQGRRKSDRESPTDNGSSSVEERISPREAPSQRDVADFVAEPGQSAESVRSLRNEVGRLSKELDASRASLNHAMLDIDARDGDIKALLDKVAQQSKDFELATKSQEASSAAVECLTRELDEYRQQIEALEQAAKDHEATSAETERLTEALDENRQQIEELEQAAKAHEATSAEVERLTAALDKSLVQIEELEEALKLRDATSAEVERLTRELDEYRQQIEAFEQAAKAHEDASAEVERLTEALDENRQRIQAFEKAAENREDTSAEVERLTRELDKNRQQIEAFEQAAKDHEETSAEVERLTRKLDENRQQIEAFEQAAKDHEETSAEVERLARELDENRQQIEAFEQAAKGHEETSAEVERLTEALEENRQQIEELEQAARAHEDASAEVERLAGSLESHQRQIEELELAAKSHGDTSAEVERLTKALKESRQNSVELENALKAEQRGAKKTQAELTKASRRFDRLEARRTTLQESVRSLKAEQKQSVAEARRNAKAQDQKIADLERAVTEAQRKGKAQDEKTADLEQAITDAKAENESLRARAGAADKLEEALETKQRLVEHLQQQLDSYVEEPTATQVHLALDMLDTNTTRTLLHKDAYSGDIASIRILKDGEKDRVVALDPNQKRLMIGRSDDSELCLQSRFVSRHHALIFLTGERAYIEDLHSYNGTIVNAKKVSRCDLQSGDTIRIGDFELQLETS